MNNRDRNSFDSNKINSVMNDDDGYDSNDEIDIEVTNCENGTTYTQIYTIPFHPTHCNEKRLLCFSTLNDDNTEGECEYKYKCTYAHNISEQKIDEDKVFMYQVLLDNNLMNFFSMTNPKTEEIYKKLFFLTHLCDKCQQKKCTGGYNCRNGVFDPSLKLCKNDLLTGECHNELISIKVSDDVINKINCKDFEPSEQYIGCLNGHHLTKRNLLPYYKYIHQKENSKKYQYHSVRYIDIEPFTRCLKNTHLNKSHVIINSDDSESETTDEEIDAWFKNKSTNDPNSSSTSE